MTRSRYAVALLLLLAGCGDAAPPATAPSNTPSPKQPQPQSLPTTAMQVGKLNATLQVAATDNQRETGLMYVHQMPADQGMIFLFPTERVLLFWMKNTPIDLDIIYVDRGDRITAIKTMHAFDETGISSDDPADVAIELNAGAAARIGLSVGDKLKIPEGLRSQAR